MVKTELLDELSAMHRVVSRLPDDTRGVFSKHYIQLFSPDEGNLEDIFGNCIQQRPHDDCFDKRFICVDGIELLWLVDKEVEDA